MDHIGIDVHKRGSPICIVAEGGELIEQRSRTEPERFAAVLGQRPWARILIEASTDSEWVARCLEGLGHEVIVADPNWNESIGKKIVDRYAAWDTVGSTTASTSGPASTSTCSSSTASSGP